MTLDTAISAINLQQWFSKLSYALMLLSIHNNTNLSLQLIQDMTLEQYPWTRRPPARCWRTPPDAHTRSGKEDATPLSKTMNFVLLYCFFLFCHLCYSISAYPKTHKPRGRASDVSTISTCFSVCYYLLPTPPPISVRTAGGITVVYLCGF